MMSSSSSASLCLMRSSASLRPFSRRHLTLSQRWSSSINSSSNSSSGSNPPTTSQLRTLALRAAIPMVGFGFIDNLVMITAGEAIDMSLGVTLGISTMAAAGFGQCVSDVAGYTGGGMVDAAVHRLNLPHHHLSQSQLNQRIARIYSTIGGSVGVVVGCLLGMTVLLFMDTDRVERAKKAKELNSIFESVMEEGHLLVDAERATLWMLDGDELWSRVATQKIHKVHFDKTIGIVGACVMSGKTVNVKDVQQDPRYYMAEIDKQSGYFTKSMVACPVKDDEGKVIGAISMRNKMQGDKIVSFSDSDERMVQMLASHVSAFMRVVNA